MDPPVPALHERADRAAAVLLGADSVHLVSHDDADGLTSAAIAATALEWADLPVTTEIKHGLDETAIDELADGNTDVVLFTDLGSGGLDRLAHHAEKGRFTPVVVDHHQPVDATIEHHLNPVDVGLDGGRELAGAGTAYVLARAIGERVDPESDPRDLAALAVVGAVGDRQTVDGELVGANRDIAEEGAAAGAIEIGTDLAVYGTQTRPLPKLLEYTGDVRIPGITGSRRGAIDFLQSLPVPVRDGDRWPTWAELDSETRQQIASGLIARAIDRGVPADRIEALVGTRYVLAREEPGTHLRDASEFATVLNATARYDRSEVGLAVCRGDRNEALDAALQLLHEHRKNLSAGIAFVEETGVNREAHVQWFHAGREIRATIVGIVAGMVLGSDGIDRHRPIVGFAKKDGSEAVKVSARAPSRLSGRGIDLSVAMREAAATVGGEGGGHAMAAGATIPEGTEPSFIDAIDAILGSQLDDA
ncbi:MAG: DHH family phosphoesterase [Halodesulfurarchaeum sp.]|nr:DHH family phosphoesterase [Halodesulfurarchaeum sp.]